MPALPQPLIDMIKDRIADPARRHLGGDDRQMGVSSDPSEIANFLKLGDGPADDAASKAFEAVQKQMKLWGQQMPTMHLSVDSHGNPRASSDSTTYPLAGPASDADLARLEQRIGRPLPEDLRQMYAIADGGWGPGQAFTLGFGPGLRSASGVINELDDLERRGPGYTGEMSWPSHLLPIGDNMGTVSYDLESGKIVQFDDYWYDNDKSIEQAFAVSHPSLADFLQEWLLD